MSPRLYHQPQPSKHLHGFTLSRPNICTVFYHQPSKQPPRFFFPLAVQTPRRLFSTSRPYTSLDGFTTRPAVQTPRRLYHHSVVRTPRRFSHHRSKHLHGFFPPAVQTSTWFYRQPSTQPLRFFPTQPSKHISTVLP